MPCLWLAGASGFPEGALRHPLWCSVFTVHKLKNLEVIKTMAVKEKTPKRTRNYATIVYPESAPENWLDVLSEQCIPCFVSPLHDKDENSLDEERKKPHYHVMLMYENVKTIEQAQEAFALIGGVGCQVVQSLRGSARYLCHLDNPEKAQYSPDEVRCFAGADYMGIIGLAIDKYKAIGEMMDYCDEKGIYSYAMLLRYARKERFDWFRVLSDSGSVVMKEFLKTKYWEMKNADELEHLAELAAERAGSGN